VYDVLTAVEKTEQVTDKESEPNGSIEYAADGKGMAVSMENFTVGYPGHPAILNRLSFSVNANDKVWITGEAGSGKSTLLRSLGAFYHNYSGNLLINDIPLANYNIQSLRLNMGMMISQQDIFEGTLMENISMGLENVNNDELLKLCKITGLNDFIATLKNGFDTALNSDGRKLPANVVRKILLMRALISKPALLLLEEPLFGFDPECRQRIRQYLLYEMPGTTLFVITNDPAFGKLCNQVIHLEKQKK
jgi:ABC-type bacteriocin/lantibiotic exporter with double-glycine peptidase domain